MQAILVKFINLIMSLVNTIIPSIDISDSAMESIRSSVNTFNQYTGVINFFFPLKTLLAILGIVITIMIVRFSMFIGNWIIKRIRGG